MRVSTVIVALGLVVAFLANPVFAEAEKPMSMAPAIIGSTWTATEINGAAAPTDRSTFLITDEMKAVGNGGCNSWFAPVVIAGETNVDGNRLSKPHTATSSGTRSWYSWSTFSAPMAA